MRYKLRFYITVLSSVNLSASKIKIHVTKSSYSLKFVDGNLTPKLLNPPKNIRISLVIDNADLNLSFSLSSSLSLALSLSLCLSLSRSFSETDNLSALFTPLIRAVHLCCCCYVMPCDEMGGRGGRERERERKRERS
jgi:hypothetical protein